MVATRVFLKEKVAVGQICLKFGRLRLRFGRLLEGGLCPLNIINNNWEIVPGPVRKNIGESEPRDFSPGKILSTLSQILRRLHKRGFHGFFF